MNLTDIVVTDVLETYTVFSKKGGQEEIINRKSYGLSFCLGGQITYTHKHKHYIAHEGLVVILPQGQNYHIQRDKTGTFPVINFTCDKFFCDDFIVMPIKNIEEIMRDFNRITSLLFFGGNRAKVMSLFYKIINNLCAYTATNPLLAPAIKYIEKNFSDPTLNNLTLAEQCRISEVYFRKQFIKQYNTSPKQFILNLRISRAKLLLSEGTHKINAISEMCGFSSVYHFSREFKLKEGVSPTEYMRNNRIYKI